MGVVLLRRGLHPLLYADSPSGLNKDIFNKALPITVHHGISGNMSGAPACHTVSYSETYKRSII
jgi:hypothetical protein